MLGCTRWGSSSVSPRGEHFLRNSVPNFWPTFVLFSYIYIYIYFFA